MLNIRQCQYEVTVESTVITINVYLSMPCSLMNASYLLQTS